VGVVILEKMPEIRFAAVAAAAAAAFAAQDGAQSRSLDQCAAKLRTAQALEALIMKKKMRKTLHRERLVG